MTSDTLSPLVSVIVIVKNGERYLASALDSILQQHYRPLEILVVDDHSTDRTSAIARSYREVQYVPLADEGMANGRNAGIDKARADWIAFLDHDDRWSPGKLNRQVRYMMEHPDLLYTITHLRFFLEPGSILRPGFKPDAFEVDQIGCTPGTLLVRKEVFDRVGLFDTTLAIGCDADWFVRARDQQIPAGILPEPLLYKRIHNTNLSSDVRTNRRELIAVVTESLKRKRLNRNMESDA